MARRRLDTTAAAATPFPKHSSPSSSSSPSNDVSPSILITVLILAIVIILVAILYFLRRLLRPDRHTATTGVFRNPLSTASEQYLRRVSPTVNALPLFTYNNQRAGDCAVCLSKFEKDDVLRLLPACCHAFHAGCIDTWLRTNSTCPLCRSPIILSEIDVIGKLTGQRSESFRVEIGNVSSQLDTATSDSDISCNCERLNTATSDSDVSCNCARLNTATSDSDISCNCEIRRTYSIGNSFHYVVGHEEDVIAEVGSPMAEYCKEAEVTEEEQGVMMAEARSCDGVCGGDWLKDYLSYSRTASFRGSGRMLDNTIYGGDEFDNANRFGDEIHALFGWLSGN